MYLFSLCRTSLWKYAITASDNNTEFKVWCCSSWECLQTIRYEAADGESMFFKTEIDPTSSYLVLTDARNRNLYVMQIMQAEEGSKTDHEQNSSNGTKPLAFIKSITEFPVSSPILSFGIVNARVRKYKCAYNDVYLLDELDDYDDDHLNRYCVVIDLFLVQPKSVQECHVLYQPSLDLEADVGSSMSALSGCGKFDNDEELANDLATMLTIKSSHDDSAASSMSNSSKPGVQMRALLDSSGTSSNDGASSAPKKSELTKGEKSSSQQSINKPSSALNLLTPDSFHSSGKLTPEGVSNEVYSALRMLAGEKPVEGSPNPLLTLVNNKQSDDETDKVQLLQQVSEDSNSGNNENSPEIVPPLPPVSMLTTGVSGGSSPSREVQEILSPKGSDFYSNSIDIQDDTDASGNNAADGNDEEKNSNQDDDETYTLNNGKSFKSFPKSFLGIHFNFIVYNNCMISVAQPTDQTNNGIANIIKSDWPDAPTVMQTFNHTQATVGPINDISLKLDQLIEVIQTQSCQISELRNEVAELKKSHSDAAIATKPSQNAEINTQKIELRVSRLIEEYLSRYEREHSQRLETFLMAR